MAILCDKDQVDVKLENAMSTMSNVTGHKHRPSIE
jgi:hypothetical protein